MTDRYDSRVARALRHPRIAAELALEIGAHPTLEQHIDLGLATEADLEQHAGTPHGGDAGGPHTHDQYVETDDVRLSDARTPTSHGEHVSTAEIDGMLDATVDAHLLASPHEAAPDLLSYATDADLGAHAETAHGLSVHAIDGAYHTGAGVLPTQGQKNALDGTTGVPGIANPYVTHADPRLSDAREPADHLHELADLPQTVIDADALGAAIADHETTEPHSAPADLSSYATTAAVSAAVAAHVSAEPHSEGGGSPLDAWPVGSVYIAVDATDPATRFGGGTWLAFAAGRMLVGLDSGDAAFDTALETGGAKTHAHAAHDDHAAQSHAGAAVANHTVTQPTASGESGHTHTYTQVPNHVHVEKVGSATTGPLSGFTPDTSTNTPVNSGYSTDNPTGGVATGTTAVGSLHTHTLSGAAVDAHQVTQPDAHGAQSHSAHDSKSHLAPYITVYMWRRTA